VRATDSTITTFDVQAQQHGCLLNQRGGTSTGDYSDAGSASHGYLRTANGTNTTFDVPHAGTGTSQGTLPQSINAAGDVAGYLATANGTEFGFVRRAAAQSSNFRSRARVEQCRIRSARQKLRGITLTAPCESRLPADFVRSGRRSEKTVRNGARLAERGAVLAAVQTTALCPVW
jgi:hypothetical protein